VRNEDVDYEVVICISSYNRFDKLNKLLSMFYEQKSKYKFKIILLDDKSTDEKYNSLEKLYPELEFYRNNRNNGRKLYWYTVTKLWNYAKSYKSNTILMIDDDFLLCKNFLNTIIDFFYHIKNDNNNVVGIAPHLHSHIMNVQEMEWWFNSFSVDGICLFDRNFIAKSFDYQLDVVTDEELKAEAHAHGWSQIQKKIKAENKVVYKTRYSLVYHDGNDESRLGFENKNKSKAYTYYFNPEGFNYKDLIV
jgi:diadenosine tetraphosphate (Ap4A) HIT family hydrolase